MLPEVTLAGIGHYTRQIGLYTVENENLYCQYLCLTRPAMDAGALSPVQLSSPVASTLSSSSPVQLSNIVIVIIFIVRFVIIIIFISSRSHHDGGAVNDPHLHLYRCSAYPPGAQGPHPEASVRH